MLSANWELLAKHFRSRDSSRQSSFNKHRQPDEEAQETAENGTPADRHAQRKARQSNRTKRQQAGEPPSVDPAAQARAPGIVNEG